MNTYLLPLLSKVPSRNQLDIYINDFRTDRRTNMGLNTKESHRYATDASARMKHGVWL